MNLILLHSCEESARLPGGDPRTRHVRDVLRMGAGDRFYVGLPNGPRGRATILADEGAKGLWLNVEWEPSAPVAQPLELVVGLPRPQTARRVLHDAASLGVRAIHFFQAEKGERSYAESRLWHSDEWQQRLQEGAAQAFSTVIPEVTHADSLEQCVGQLEASGRMRYALDIYEASSPLAAISPAELRAPGQGRLTLALAIGAERGWSEAERSLLRAADFELVHLGERVLRTEAAVIAGATLALAALGALDQPYLVED
ncbi:16S rRNA (uracil(1498)-N(3))-methyltransferase [Ruficoccus amylovorans]|uniref:Ribosomal RNA small subunit methyltransferase E n=1 Tax=Ruficoccus amylovorans TaxID=1804625 RepID=A0A842HI17_9BACT|nr:RsmE family RNA methyltransferase [Ruficoccus amylovorans]MBC2595810.1 16S rRNA (uracil(1498)-N(3))-methyltransferase [Ruficoccus amylovorans]